MDAVSGLLRMMEISLFLAFRKRAMVLNIKFKSLLGKEIPRITHERISLIFLIFMSRYYGRHGDARQEEPHEHCDSNET
jgi:hypothetical protein